MYIHIAIERFIGLREKAKKDEILKAFATNGVLAQENSLKVIRELRYGLNR